VERRFRGDDRDAQFDWQRTARELEVAPRTAHALYVRAVQRVLDPRDAEVLYLGWLRAAAAARRVPHTAVPGRQTRVLAESAAADASAALDGAVPGKQTRVAAAWPAADLDAPHAAGAAAQDRDRPGRPAAHLLRDAGGDAAPAPDDPAVAAALRERGRGTPLAAALRAEMEAHLGVPLAGVRLHDDAVAHAAAAAVRARAFTVGEDIYFAAGAPAPGSQDGRGLLAHELAHVAQAIEGRVPDEGGRRVSQPSEPLELEARAIATRISAAPAPPGPRQDRLAMFAPPRTARSAGPILRHDHDHDGGQTAATPSPQTPPSPSAQPPGAPPPVQAVDVLEPSESFRALGPPASAQVVMRRAWLVAQGIAATEQNVTVQTHPGPVRAVMRDLRDRVFPWASDDRLEQVSATGQIGLPAPLGQLPEQFARPVERSIISAFGLPAAARIVTYRRTTGLEIWFDADYLRSLHPRTVGGRSVVRDPGLMERYATALETEVGAAMRPELRQALLHGAFTCAVQLDHIAHVYFHAIDEQVLIGAFGAEAIRAYRGRTEAAGDGQAVVASPAGNVTLPPGLSADDRRMVERLLPQIYGGQGAATPTRLTDADVQALRQLDADPDRAEILALMHTARGGGGGGDPQQSLADLIDTVRQQVAIHRSAAHPPLSGEARHPLVPRPVHGHIRNRSGELVPGMDGQFDFVEDDVVDRFSVPWVIIHWAAVQTHDVQVASDLRTVHQVPLASPVRIATEVTHYISVDPQGPLNDRIFNFRFRQPGVYQIEAVVDHSFYFPAHFTLTGGVEVLPEAARHREQQDHAFAGLGRGPTTTESHQFDVLGYGDGERARGRLAPGALGRPAGEASTQSMDDEIRQLEALQRQYAHSDEADARAILEYVQTRLSHLRDARGALGATLADRANQVVRTWGAYTSRTAGVTSGDLRVVTWLRAQTGGFEGHLLDHTQLYEAQNYQVSETASDREALLEALFVALTRSYPEGTLTLRFERPDAPGQFVQYTRVTDTIRRDITSVVFSQPVALAVNLTALVIGIFNPLAGILISVAYNGAQTADDLQHQAAQGTLTAQHTATSLGLLAIDLLPAAGLSSRFIQLGRTAFYILEATQLAGSALLVAPQAAERIAQLREGEIRELAQLEDTIRTRRANNPSDAGLRDLEAQAHALRARVESQGRDVIAEMVAQQLIILATGAVVQGAMRRQISERVRGSALHDIAAITGGEQLHVPVGSSMSRADGEAALAALARGDRGALASAGLGRLPETFDPRSVRWGLAELPDGDVIVLRGGPDSVDWSQLPAGVRRVSETEAGTVRTVASPEGSGAGDGSDNHDGHDGSGGGHDGSGGGHDGSGGGHDGSGGGHDGSGGGHDGSGPRRVYVAADPVQLEHYRTQYPDIAAHSDSTPVYRYAETTAVPDNGVSYWQTEAPHPDYTSHVVVETTMGELRRSGEVRVDPYAPEATGESLVVLHNPGTTTAPGTTRRVLGRTGAQGTGAAVLEGDVPSGLWRDWDGNIHDGPELFRAAPGRGGGGGDHGSGSGAGGDHGSSAGGDHGHDGPGDHPPPSPSAGDSGHEPPRRPPPSGNDPDGHDPSGPRREPTGPEPTGPEPTGPESEASHIGHVPGLYDHLPMPGEHVDPHGGRWRFQHHDLGVQNGVHQIEVEVFYRAPGSGEQSGYGRAIWGYDPATQTLVLDTIDLQHVPGWIEGLPQQLSPRGTPTQAYLSMRAMRQVPGAPSSGGPGWTRFRVAQIDELESICQLEVARRQRPDVPIDQLAPGLHAARYPSTPLQQAGFDTANPRITGGERRTLRQSIELWNEDVRPGLEDTVRRHGLSLDDEVLAGFDLEFDLRPATDRATAPPPHGTDTPPRDSDPGATR
jgi:hypothetical protein